MGILGWACLQGFQLQGSSFRNDVPKSREFVFSLEAPDTYLVSHFKPWCFIERKLFGCVEILVSQWKLLKQHVISTLAPSRTTCLDISGMSTHLTGHCPFSVLSQYLCFYPSERRTLISLSASRKPGFWDWVASILGKGALCVISLPFLLYHSPSFPFSSSVWLACLKWKFQQQYDACLS